MMLRQAYVPPAKGAQLIYVDQAGNDVNMGAIDKPLRTIARAAQLMQPDRGDRVYIQYGQIYREHSPIMIPKSSSPIGTGAGIYATGDDSKPKPLIVAPQNSTAIAAYAPLTGFVLSGFQLQPFAPKQASDPKGIALGQQISNFVIEDCNVDGFAINISVLNNTGSQSSDIHIKRCSLTNAYGNSEFNGQGIYAENVDRLIVEDSFLDNNGNGPSVYRHGMYLSNHGVTNAQIRRTYVGHSAAFGIQLRGSGVVEDCIFEDNGVAMAFGGAYGYAFRNYVYGCHDAASNVLSTGISMNAVMGQIQANIIYDPNGKTYVGKYPGPALSLLPRDWTPQGPRNVRIFDNMIMNWPGPVLQQNASSDWDIIIADNNVVVDPNAPLIVARSRVNTAAVMRLSSNDPKSTLDLKGSSGITAAWLLNDFYKGQVPPKPTKDVMVFLQQVRSQFPIPNLQSSSGSGT